MSKKFHPKHFFTHDEIDRITEAIRAVESRSTGRIDVYLEWECPVTDPLSRAIKIFHKLGLDRHPGKNALLVYIATKHRLFAVIGDQKLNEKMSPDLWAGLQYILEIRFRNNRYCSSILLIIEQIGGRMIEFFPPI